MRTGLEPARRLASRGCVLFRDVAAFSEGLARFGGLWSGVLWLLCGMDNEMDVLSVERVKHERRCGIIVIFSDGTVARYPPEELAELRPYRELADIPANYGRRVQV